MTFSFPQNADDFLVMLVPLLTLMLSFAFLVVPGRMFRFMGLEAQTDRPSAICEGRSSFTGSMLAVASACLLLQEPIALQPGLNLMLAVGWTVSAFGRILQMVLDKGLQRKRIQVRFAIAVGLAALAWSVTEIPYLACADPTSQGCSLPTELKGQFLFVIAAVTFVLGLVALFLPTFVLRKLGLQTRINKPFARGETRGTLAGFNIAVGGTYLLMPQPVDFVALVLGGAWLFAGIGRLISLVIGRDLSLRNGILMGFQIGIGALCVAIVLRII